LYLNWHGRPFFLSVQSLSPEASGEDEGPATGGGAVVDKSSAESTPMGASAKPGFPNTGI
jgi:hypothetical protein